MKPYHSVVIQECGEPLVPIPLEVFAVESPHPYEKLGADYQGKSPYFLRQGVLEALIAAQNQLEQICPGWQIQIFDAYRPIQVQQFMVDYTFASVLEQRGLIAAELSPSQQEQIWQEVYQLWAIPSYNPLTPPPHSTGAAIDLTLVDAQGQVVDMGGSIDELSERSQPNYYENNPTPEAQEYHRRRELLSGVMKGAGFSRHPGEWWHFSLGDQMWAWLHNQDFPHHPVNARYGRF